MSAPIKPPGGEVRVYEAADGEVCVDARLDGAGADEPVVRA